MITVSVVLSCFARECKYVTENYSICAAKCIYYTQNIEILTMAHANVAHLLYLLIVS